MKCIWSCENPPGPDVLAVAMDVRLLPFGGLFRRALYEAAGEQGCALILLCDAAPEYSVQVAQHKGFHHLVHCNQMQEGVGCPVLAQLFKGVAVAGSIEATDMLWAVKTPIIFHSHQLPADAPIHGTAASAARVREMGRGLSVSMPKRAFRDGGVILESVLLDGVLPPSLVAAVQQRLSTFGCRI